jgi:hypothetical protein
MRLSQAAAELAGPPESGRYSFAQKTSGDSFSVISTGTTPTPLGKAVVLEAILARTRAGAAEADVEHVEPRSGGRLRSPAAAPRSSPRSRPGRGPSSACARQPNIRSGNIWPITCRAVTGAGRSG